jgi:hypothetical protein
VPDPVWKASPGIAVGTAIAGRRAKHQDILDFVFGASAKAGRKSRMKESYKAVLCVKTFCGFPFEFSALWG